MAIKYLDDSTLGNPKAAPPESTGARPAGFSG